jgi:hypothetical protein
LVLILGGLAGCGGGESHDAEASPLAPVAIADVPPTVNNVAAPGARAPAPAPAPSGAAPAGAAPSGAAPAGAAPTGGTAELGPKAAKLVDSAIALYTGFLAAAAKHPEDCVALQGDLRALADKHKSEILEIKNLQSTLGRPQLMAAQARMKSGLPESFFPTLIDVSKRCAATPGFADTMGVLQGKTAP